MPDCKVWPEHWATLDVFLVCQSQWRTNNGKVLGLDLGVVLQIADLYAVDNKRQLVEEIQVIADKAAELINKQLSED